VRWSVEFQGDRCQLRRVDLGAEARRDRREQLRSDAADALDAANDGQVLDADALDLLLGETAVAAAQSVDPSPRGPVDGWSAKSRRNFLRTVAGLDMPGRWGMLTLTLPGAWLEFAPDPARFKAALKALRQRYVRRFGEAEWSALWKLEFQRRGAPHFHVGLRLGDSDRDRERAEFLRVAWHEVVCHDQRNRHGRCPGTSCVHRDHLRHGARLDFEYADRIRRAGKALAGYFAKHGVWASKAYQHERPGQLLRSWADFVEAATHRPGACDQLRTLADGWDHPGRWWGVQGIDGAPLTEGEFTAAEVEAARLIARKVTARRTWRYVEVPDASRPVLMRRTVRSLHGDAGFWLLTADPLRFRWWFLDQVRTVAELDGIERARYLAGIEEPGSRPPPMTRRRLLAGAPA
jgi:hypothetical protein